MFNFQMELSFEHIYKLPIFKCICIEYGENLNSEAKLNKNMKKGIYFNIVNITSMTWTLRRCPSGGGK